eukprot:TRINITY_DN4303_c0_g1_i4.p1 TRINITY_DN4303_c0_g1~~TRINITY_DN4303_c0_g1_i4.p1  ORF type:complete len:124 (-),score=30.44 TRINITY_DN4303_c0_g1_i4:74-445(-)
MDSKHSELLGKLSTIALNVTSKPENITSVCKLLFRLSKDEANDQVIGQSPLLAALLKLAEGVSQLPYETLIFIGGVFKNAALSGPNRHRLLSLALVHRLANVLRSVQGGDLFLLHIFEPTRPY